MNFKLRYIQIGLPVLLIVMFVVFTKAQNRATCIITPAVLNTSDVKNSVVNFSWNNGQNSKITYLNVSTSNSLNSDGSLQNADIVNDTVTNKDSYSKSKLKSGTYYWNIVSDGCKQRKVSNLASFTIDANVNAECKAKPAVLSTPLVKGSKVTLSWTNDQDVEAAYINISSSNAVNTDGVLQKLDISNDVVSDATSLTRENLSPGSYYWNIVSDSCGERKISNLGSFTIQPE